MRFRKGELRAMAALVVAIVLLIGAAGGIATQQARATDVVTDTSYSLSVTTTAPYTFDPNNFQMVPTNSTINVTVTDADTLAHTFSIINWEGVQLPPSANIPTVVSAHGTLFAANVSGAGDRATGSFTSPGPGWYEFVCQEPGHYAAGMYGFIAFGINLPPNVTVTTASTGPGAAVFIIVGTIAALVVIAIVLGFVVGRRHGSEYEMPPERLGYAEPPNGGNSPPLSSSPPTKPNG